jgi:hypothetical protein
LVTSFFQIFVNGKFIDSIFKNKDNYNYSVTTDGVDTAVASGDKRNKKEVKDLETEKFFNLKKKE